jgi:sulfur-carrier protein
VKARFHLPLFLKPLADGLSDVDVSCDGATVSELLRALFAAHPALQDRIVTEQFVVRPHVNVFVGEESIRFTGGLSTKVRDGDVITILPAVSGG